MSVICVGGWPSVRYNIEKDWEGVTGVYVSRLEIAGFKSFGGRVKLDFKPGISAVVGPNGSGKSNIAEAIRWALGTQNVRELRAQKTSELIYAGSEGKGKARASMAEVTLTLKGRARDTELGVEELIITRRLYRSGETEYFLGGRPVRVKDLQRILAQAGFGAASYTVIGQGMVDSLIIATPSERQLLFEEASGIRAYELQRIDDTRKLDKARAQAAQLREDMAALAPEQAQLEQQLKLLERRRNLKDELNEARRSWLWHELQRLETTQSDQEKQAAAYKHDLQETRRKLVTAEKALQSVEKAEVETNQRQTGALRALEELEDKQLKYTEQIAQAQAELQVLEATQTSDEKPAKLKRDLRNQENRLKQLKSYLRDLTQKNSQFEQKIATFNDKIAALNTELNGLRQKLTANQRNAYLQQALGLARVLLNQMQRPEAKKPLEGERLQLHLHKLIRMVKLATEADLSELPAKIARLQQSIARELTKREDVVEKQTAEIIKQRSVELDINALDKVVRELKTQIADLPETDSARDTLRQTISRLEAELKKVAREIKQKRQSLTEATVGQHSGQQRELAEQLATLRSEERLAEQALERLIADQQQSQQLMRDVREQAAQWKLAIPKQATSAGVSDPSVLAKLEAELELIGEVDEALVGVHDELRERLEYFESQAVDLETAAADLEKVLAELERRIRKTFTDNFKKINQGFARHFKELFHGGTAALELTAQEDGSFGIEITAKPPGKRVEQLSSLSGGEKALAAIALLAAILDVNPSPFIVLDEVDAALDDANSRAFTDLLRTLQKRSQLIVITHNHETMLQADELFGITSSAKTSSTVVAVDLRQAEELITPTA